MILVVFINIFLWCVFLVRYFFSTVIFNFIEAATILANRDFFICFYYLVETDSL